MTKDERPGVPDGMKVDLDGNLYCTGPGGVWIIAPAGKHLGTIALGDGKRATNVGWGGGDWKTLFITTFHTGRWERAACFHSHSAGAVACRVLVQNVTRTAMNRATQAEAPHLVGLGLQPMVTHRLAMRYDCAVSLAPLGNTFGATTEAA